MIEEYDARVDVTTDQFKRAITRELRYLRALSQNKSLVHLGTNLGVLEAVLIIMQAGEEGVPVYTVLESMQSSFVSESAIIKRLRILREAGLIDQVVGQKRSNVNLLSSKELSDEFGPLLLAKHA